MTEVKSSLPSAVAVETRESRDFYPKLRCL